MDINGIIANNIKVLRKVNGMSQREVADAIAIDDTVYSRIENGLIMPSHDKLYKLSKLYRIPIEKFYEGLGSNIQNNYDSSQVNSNVQINMTDNAEMVLSELIEIKELLKLVINK